MVMFASVVAALVLIEALPVSRIAPVSETAPAVPPVIVLIGLERLMFVEAVTATPPLRVETPPMFALPALTIVSPCSAFVLPTAFENVTSPPPLVMLSVRGVPSLSTVLEKVTPASVEPSVSKATFAPRVTGPVKLTAPAGPPLSVAMFPASVIAEAVTDRPPLRVVTAPSVAEAALLTVSDCSACVPPTAPPNDTAPVPAAMLSVRLLAAASASTVVLKLTFELVVVSVVFVGSVTAPV